MWERAIDEAYRHVCSVRIKVVSTSAINSGSLIISRSQSRSLGVALACPLALFWGISVFFFSSGGDSLLYKVVAGFLWVSLPCQHLSDFVSLSFIFLAASRFARTL